ncbi:MAG: YkgJ family cysteine cluster protein [Nitrospirae bacterium]|nr:YkgJ family cysteine cluster protein [Nitrospirota bacterium]
MALEKRTRRGRAKEPNCDGCGECCLYVALEIDRPTCKRDYSDIIWHLLHEGVSVYIDHDNKWHVEFASRCANLSADGRCGDYEGRPMICRKYSLENCTRHSKSKYYAHRFATPDELKKYLGRMKIDFEFRRIPKDG